MFDQAYVYVGNIISCWHRSLRNIPISVQLSDISYDLLFPPLFAHTKQVYIYKKK